MVPHEAGEFGFVGALLLGLDKLRCRVYLAGEARRVFVVPTAHELYGRARVKGRPEFGRQLVEVLVRDRDPDLVLAPLVEELGGLVVEVAQQDVNPITDITVLCRSIKKQGIRGKVVKLEFIFSEKEKKPDILSEISSIAYSREETS
ncbi:MAG: hypothetical protein IPL87_05290 [Candidatus Moraniibacteriota bacterium]|nr:MAG: hypothetical protein IPL87_05290 [Candidatus Moranbacteria bacterium]